MKMIKNEYPLEWLDSLVLQHFNPAKTDVARLSESDLALISNNIVLECSRIQVRVKNEIFAMKRKRQIRLLVRKYHATLIFLMDNMVESCSTDPFQMPILCSTANGVVSCLDELLSFLENRYAAYLNLDEKAPVSYLLVSRKEMGLKLKKIMQRELMKDEGDQEIFKLAADELKSALSLQNRSRTTFRQVLYQRKVLKELDDPACRDFSSDFLSSLDSKLIGLNFNSRNYFNLLIKRLEAKLELAESITQKLNLLRYYLKELRKMEVSKGMFLNGDVQPINTVIENWLRSEIEYYEKMMESSATTIVNATGNEEANENKLECDLSADQIGIILRAADEARVVKSRSMSLVFQRIVPHLSTAYKKQLSYQSVRSKSYNAEENDKNIAILTLEKMIRKIQSY